MKATKICRRATEYLIYPEREVESYLYGNKINSTLRRTIPKGIYNSLELILIQEIKQLKNQVITEAMIVEYMEIKNTQRYYKMKYTSIFEMNIGQIYGRAIDLYERSKLFDKIISIQVHLNLPYDICI